MVELILPGVVALISGAGVVVVVERVRRRALRSGREYVPVPGSDAESTASVVRGARRLTAWAGGAGFVVAVVLTFGLGFVSIGPAGLSQWSRYAFTTLPPVSGALLVFAPLVGAAVFAAVIALRPAVQWGAARPMREADLLAERPHALLRELFGFAAAAIALLTLTALTSTAVRASDTAISTALIVTRAGTTNEIAYPGQGYVLAVVVMVLVVAALVVAAVAQVQAAPGPGVHTLVDVDRAVRRWQTGSIALAGTVAMILSIGITSWAIGQSYVTISRFPVIGDCHSTGRGSSICREVGAHYAQPAFAIGMTEIVVGVVLVAVSLTLVIVIARRIRRGVRLFVPTPTDSVPA